MKQRMLGEKCDNFSLLNVYTADNYLVLTIKIMNSVIQLQIIFYAFKFYDLVCKLQCDLRSTKFSIIVHTNVLT